MRLGYYRDMTNPTKREAAKTFYELQAKLATKAHYEQEAIKAKGGK
jgi:hypothetical protein